MERGLDVHVIMKMMEKNVTIYSTPYCHFCNVAKQYFTEKGLPYTEHNVAQDQQRLHEMMMRSGQMGVPVISIGEDVIVGFNRPVIEQLLSS